MNPVNHYEMKFLYDGLCPFCRDEMMRLKRWDTEGRLEFEDINRPGFDAAVYGTTPLKLRVAVHAVTPDGQVLKGMDAIRRGYAAVGRGWIFAPTGWTMLRPMFDRMYLSFARNRITWSRVLGRKICDSGHCTAGL
jgi:predicted DCC family thiol-disulfide oxidoreductase YuxK